MAQNANSLVELKTQITSTFPDITNTALADVARAAFEQDFLQGMADASTTEEIK
jgi:hypothetical protein